MAVAQQFPTKPLDAFGIGKELRRQHAKHLWEIDKDRVERWRLGHVRQLVQDYGVQGAILIQQKFCDPHEYDMAPLQALFQERDIPSLRLEADTTIPVGQFRTRVEAFMGMLQLETV